MPTSTSDDQNIVFGSFLPPFSTGIPGNFSQPKSFFKFASLFGTLSNIKVKSVELEFMDFNGPTEDQIQQYWS